MSMTAKKKPVTPRALATMSKAAALLGRRGGEIGGKLRMANLTPEERAALGRKGGLASGEARREKKPRRRKKPQTTEAPKEGQKRQDRMKPEER